MWVYVSQAGWPLFPPPLVPPARRGEPREGERKLRGAREDKRDKRGGRLRGPLDLRPLARGLVCTGVRAIDGISCTCLLAQQVSKGRECEKVGARMVIECKTERKTKSRNVAGNNEPRTRPSGRGLKMRPRPTIGGWKQKLR